MKSRIHLKLLMAPLSMLAVLACSPDQYQQASEYDDVYFTSADRKTAPKVIAKPEEVQAANTANVITLANQSKKSVDPTLLERYNNSETKEVEYFVEGEGGPRVTKASELNYDDFVWDYENQLLATYALPVDWVEEWDERYFNNLVYNDFEFRLAWYDQYYQGNSTRMDRYITASNGRIGRTSMATFGGNRFRNNFWSPGINVSIGFGRGFGFYDPFFAPVGFGYDPFFDPFYDPFFFNAGFGFNRWNRWNRWNRGWGFGFGRGFGFGFGGGIYCPPIFSNQYIYRGEVFVARNNRTFTRGGRLSSTSVANVRSDANNGVAQTRSQRLASTSGTSRVSRSAIENRASRSGRVSSSRVSSSRTSRSSTSTGRSSRSQVVSTRSNRVRTDAYRFNDSRSSSRTSSRVSSSSSRGRSSAVTSRTSRSARNTSTFSGGRASNRSTSGRTSGVSFNRNSSSRSSSGVSRSSSRSSSSRSYSRSSSRSSSSRGVSRSSSRSSSSRSGVSRSSSSRSSGSVSRSSRSGGSSRSSSSRSSSSRSGRGRG